MINICLFNMETKKSMKPMNLSEMLPALRGIMSKEDFQMHTEQNRPRSTMLPTRSSEKVYKPLTMVELSSVIQELNSQSSRKPAQATSAIKKKWNTSVKVERKMISRTANGKMGHNPVRKVLDMASNTKIPSTNNKTTRVPMTSETPKFPKPEYKAKKALSLHGRNNVRISGICAIPETPLVNKPKKLTRQIAINKENIPITPSKDYTTTKSTSKVSTHTKLITPILDSPQSKETWISSCDDSFLQREKEIQDIEQQTNVICEEQALDIINEIPPSMSTPFKGFRSTEDFFNDSSRLENSELCCNDTIMSFDKTSPNENKREESVIVSLCNLLNEANLLDSNKDSTDLNDIVEFQRESNMKIKMIEQIIDTLTRIKEKELKSLETVTKLIEKKHCGKTKLENTESQQDRKSVVQSKSCSVIKRTPKSPTYQIPKKNSSLRKSVISKSVPNITNLQMSPHKTMNEKALNMYMKMKKHVTFLNTPVKSEKKMAVASTPSAIVTSLNLQKQLDRLYGD